MTRLDSPQKPVALVDLLDRVLNKGVVVAGDLVISVADIDLLYLDLRLLITSVETALRLNCPAVCGADISPEGKQKTS